MWAKLSDWFFGRGSEQTYTHVHTNQVGPMEPSSVSAEEFDTSDDD